MFFAVRAILPSNYQRVNLPHARSNALGNAARKDAAQRNLRQLQRNRHGCRTRRISKVSTMQAEPDLSARLAARAPNGRRPQVMHHRWETLLFLHWRCAPSHIQSTLPPGLTVDTFEGEAFIGITPFFMRNVRLVGMPMFPGMSFFQELNVRTYAFDHMGTPGVWFYSLDCNRAMAVLGARIMAGLRYFHAHMSGRRNTEVTFASRRRGTQLTARYRYRPLGNDRPTEPDSLEFFLLERYFLFSYRRERRTLFRGQVSHEPYRYRDVELSELSTIPAQLDDLRGLADWPDHACAVDGFDVQVFGQEKVS
jgi:uncharacterized protein YqjF (DUF2071 family)